MDSDLIELSLVLVHETEAAILVDDVGHQVWLPKSQIEIVSETPRGAHVIVELNVPEWLAIDKELV